MSLDEKLTKIRSSPKLQGQEYTAALLNAIEDTLKGQSAEPSPAAYFAALLSLLSRSGAIEKDYAESKSILHGMFYLLDLVAKEVSQPLLRSKFSTILPHITTVLTHAEAEAPLVKSCIGTLEPLLIAQDSQAWKLPASDIGPRRGLALIMTFTLDARPKVRKRALDAVVHVLESPPPSPLVGHPAIDMCAESALQRLTDAASGNAGAETRAVVTHVLHLTKAMATAAKGWPDRSIQGFCRCVLDLSRSADQHVVMACFEAFEAVLAGMSNSPSAKFPEILQVIAQLQPSKEDSQLLPTWVAVLSRAYEVSAQTDPTATFARLPEAFNLVAEFLTSNSYNIRASSSECLIAFVSTCVPTSILQSGDGNDELMALGQTMDRLLSVRFQTAWTEVFGVLTVLLQILKSRSFPVLRHAVETVGNLRSNEAFAGKKEADAVLSAAITAVGPKAVFKFLPLNLVKPRPGQPGRAWMLPLMRTAVRNTSLAHFKHEMLPFVDAMSKRAADGGAPVEVKIFQTLVQQAWATLPGYCILPNDLTVAFDDSLAEQLATALYEHPDRRVNICQGLRNLVESNKNVDEYPDVLEHVDRAGNLAHLANYANQLLAVLFNVYSQTLPQNRISIAECIHSYLGILPLDNLVETFDRVVEMLGGAMAQQPENNDKNKDTSHTLMDLVVIMSSHLPAQSYGSLSQIVQQTINKDDDPQMQKKTYKLLTRLAASDTGKILLREQNESLQQIYIASAANTSGPARRERLAAIAQIVPELPATDLHFIPSILSEVVISVKETNEKAREAAFDLLVLMGERMAAGGTVVNAKVPHMNDETPSVPASLEEYFTMVSAGLAGSTPHMISATITALARLLYEFQARLPQPAVDDLVQTIDLFLTSQNREIVRSCLGFVKVCVLSLPTEMMQPRLATLIPNLCVWSHEHKAQFKAKVKHIFERLIRRFGVDVVSRFTPAADAKLITNIRKAKDRAKRKKDAGPEASGDQDQGQTAAKPQGRFESEYDQALYESESGSEASGSDDDEMLGRGPAAAAGGKNKKKAGTSYIVEGDDEPFDLLDKQALAHVSSTKPQKAAPVRKQRNAQVDVDGKLVIKGDDDDNAANEDGDMDFELDTKTLGQGIDAYVDAIKSHDAAKEGQRGKLKFSNNNNRRQDVDMERDESGAGSTPSRGRGRGVPGKGNVQQGRKGLGAEKQRGPPQGRTMDGRVSKPSRGGSGGGRGRGGSRGRGGRGGGRGRGRG